MAYVRAAEGAQVSHHFLGDLVVVQVDVRGVLAEEERPGHVVAGVQAERVVQPAAGVVDGEQVEEPVHHDGWVRPGVHQLQQLRGDHVGLVGQVGAQVGQGGEVGARVVVEQQRPRQRLDDRG